MTKQLLATLAFFFATIQAKVEALGLDPERETLVHQQLIPAIDLEWEAACSTHAERHHALHSRSRALLAPLRKPARRYSELTPNCVPGSRLSPPIALILSSAALIQRSSSCVECHNRQLGLYHHSKHSLSTRKLAVFTYLLDELEPPPRSAHKCPRSPRVTHREHMAA